MGARNSIADGGRDRSQVPDLILTPGVKPAPQFVAEHPIFDVAGGRRSQDEAWAEFRRNWDAGNHSCFTLTLRGGLESVPEQLMHCSAQAVSNPEQIPLIQGALPCVQ